jgi:PAS domain S-box-containing protein
MTSKERTHKKERYDQQDSELKLSAWMDSMPDFLCFKDGEGRWLEANAFALKVFQLENLDFKGKKNTELVSPGHLFHEALKECDISDAAAWQDGAGWRGEEIVPQPDGRMFVFDVIKMPSFHPDGSRKALAVVGRDITERKRVEQMLARERIILYNLQKNIPNFVYIKDREGRFLWINEAKIRHLGFRDAEEVNGKTDFDFFAPEHAKASYADEQQIIATGVPILGKEEKEVWSDGHVTWVSTSKAPLTDAAGNIEGIMGISCDITQQKETEVALEESEKKARHLNELLRAMYDIQHLIRNESDEGKLFEGVCNVLVETRGYLAAWIGVPQPDSKLVRPVAQAGQAQRILREAPIPWDDTPNGLGPCGTAVREWAPCIINDIDTDPRFDLWRDRALAAGCGSIASFPILTEKRLWGVITIKAAQPSAFSEEEIDLLADLANEVGQAVENIHNRIHSERLEEAYRQEQKMAAIGQLAGGVAHDFNNILGASMLQIGLLMERPDLTPELRKGLEELEQGAFRASNLTRQLLMFSREQGVQMKTLDMKVVVDAVKGMVSRLLGETVLMKVETDMEPMWVKGDHGMIEQVIVNLCVNARDAMPDGGKLTIRVEKVEIEAGNDPVHLNIHPGKFVCLSVIDTGTGIAPENIKHIFEPFFTTKEVGEGTGLGLATIHGIIQRHGGWVEVESKVGAGTVFRVHLPAFAEEQATAAERKINRPPRGRETILLVEDDKVLLRSVIGGLQLLGYRVIEAVDGVDALLKWQEHGEEIDLILTDMVMPGGISGLELAQQIQNAKPGFKIIISSGYSDALINFNPELCSGITLLPKPYGIPGLARTIRQCLDSGDMPNPVQIPHH